MKDVGQRRAEVEALKHAIPYVRMYRGKTFVVKVGGGALADAGPGRALVEQVDALHQLGIRVVLVHGGGPQATDLGRALGSEPRFAAGRRVTDDAALRATVLALNGEVNTRLLQACRAVGLQAVGVSGVDAGLLTARRRPPVRVAGEPQPVDYGWVGDLAACDVAVLRHLLAGGYLPVVSSLAADERGALLNVNADTAAAALAVALAAEKLILMTGAPGLLEDPDDPGSLVSYTDLRGLRALGERGRLRDGMLPKAEAIEAALAGGVRRAHLVAYAQPDALLAEVFTNEGIGTLVVEDIHALSPDEAGG
jgi:acetylglutamate kinase